MIFLLLHLPKHIRRKKINIFYPSIFLSFLDFLSLHHPSSQRNDLGFVSTHNLIICPTFYKAASSLSLLSLYGLFVTKKVMRWLLHNIIFPTFYKAFPFFLFYLFYGISVTKKVMRWLLLSLYSREGKKRKKKLKSSPRTNQ